ncbi:hypothetical protein IDJ77_21710 [Mucilaginibacter sp. ZT4R22]|uniref:Pentapeptide MXKDX repeat protein n=1 Tax=Mucilaginibacter pankratovii TaxID=2772110 RepID=A0ABR7WVY3_9SPHI|nr:hypothetical protein [Mucilaginibacter pankratovii]MBD1366445.1 hypothetical protein [Mucilaginibacter pankratovii]
MKKAIIAAALVLTTGILSAYTIIPAKRDTTTTKPSTKKDIGQADTKKDIGQADTKKDIGQAD